MTEQGQAPQRATPADAGCWIDGHWGQYAVARSIQIAASLGYSDAEAIDIAARHLASMGPSTAPEITDDEAECLYSQAGYGDSACDWLNDHIAPEGYSFDWWEGEFFLSADDCNGKDCGMCWACAYPE